MTVRATFLHSRPQQEISKLIRTRLAGCLSARIVSGFATPDGVDALRAAASATRIARLVLGAGTFKAFEALDGLLAAGLSPASPRVHLGHSRPTGGKRNPFARFRPMLHSKIYFEMPDGTAAALVGSHNLTGFALRGLNGEAGVLLEGPVGASIFDDVRSHIEESYRQAAPYDPSLKEAYARWFRDFLEQLSIDATDMPRDDESRRTIILFAQASPSRAPSLGERIYFEIDQRITEVNSIDTEVHLHLFSTMPTTPAAALSRSGASDVALLGKVEAIDSAAGSAEVRADWFIDGSSAKPRLKPTTSPFRPKLTPGKQQIRAQILGSLDASSTTSSIEVAGTGRQHSENKRCATRRRALCGTRSPGFARQTRTKLRVSSFFPICASCPLSPAPSSCSPGAAEGWVSARRPDATDQNGALADPAGPAEPGDDH